MKDTASINGNLFSNGPITGAGNSISGGVISASTTIGSINNIKSTGSMYAKTITNSTIGGSAFCTTISGSSPNTCTASASTTPATLPITQTQITQWEADALAGGTIVCTGNTYTINTAVNLGPVKIVGPGNTACDVTMNGNAVVTLGGTVWVTGSITIKSNAELKVSNAFSGQSIVVIADNPADRLTSSTVNIQNNAIFTSSSAGSYVMLLGQNNGASQNPPQNTEAVEVEDYVQGVLLVYAGLGDILIKGHASLKEVTAYKITLANLATVTYASGLASTVFTSGPGGSWVISDWKEGQ
jgi:formylmethanofuran dehydrogenase subunit C